MNENLESTTQQPEIHEQIPDDPKASWLLKEIQKHVPRDGGSAIINCEGFGDKYVRIEVKTQGQGNCSARVFINNKFQTLIPSSSMESVVYEVLTTLKAARVTLRDTPEEEEARELLLEEHQKEEEMRAAKMAAIDKEHEQYEGHIPLMLRFKKGRDSKNRPRIHEEPFYIVDPRGSGYSESDDDLGRRFGGYLYVGGELISLADAQKLPFAESGTLDLTHLPVICLRGSNRKSPDEQMREFQQKNPDFLGAFYLCQWSGGVRSFAPSKPKIVLPSKEALDPRQRIQGGKPVEKFVNQRWDAKGRYFADEVSVLHDRIVKNLQSNVELEPGPEFIARALLSQEAGMFAHPLREIVRKVRDEVMRLELLSVRYDRSKLRDIDEMVVEALMSVLKRSNVKKIVDIPDDFTFTAKDVAPGLAERRDELGVIEIPGIGKRIVSGWDSQSNHPYITLSPSDIQNIKQWPFTDISIYVPEIKIDYDNNNKIRRLLFQEGEDRWHGIKEEIANQWEENIIVGLWERVVGERPETPDPITKTNPITGEKVQFVASVVKDTTANLSRTGTYWKISWKARREE